MRIFGKLWKIMTFAFLFSITVPYVCAAAGKMTSEEAAVRRAVKEHYEFLSDADIDELIKYEGLSKSSALSVLTAKELGMREYANLEFYDVWQLEAADRTIWIPFVSYDLVVDGLPLLPGATSGCVVKENGKFRVVADMEEEWQQLLDEAWEEKNWEDVQAWLSGVESEYYVIAEENAEVRDWIERYEEEKKKKELEYQDWLLADNREFPMEEYRKKQGAEEKATDGDRTDHQYTVQSGDCLWNISVRHYGKGAAWSEIYEQNKSVIGNDPAKIYPGQVLHLK